MVLARDTDVSRSVDVGVCIITSSVVGVPIAVALIGMERLVASTGMATACKLVGIPIGSTGMIRSESLSDTLVGVLDGPMSDAWMSRIREAVGGTSIVWIRSMCARMVFMASAEGNPRVLMMEVVVVSAVIPRDAIGDVKGLWLNNALEVVGS
jgi:hypothetical protein